MPDGGTPSLSGWRARAHEIIFEADTPLGKAFDVVLIVSIVASIVAVMLESVESVGGPNAPYRSTLQAAEWAFTLLFTVEYLLRLACVAKPMRYARSFFGIVDLLAILPTYISLILPGTQALLVIRILRILRVFRVLKLAHYVRESDTLMRALLASRRKIAVFVFAVLTLVIVFGALMYLVEGKANGFGSIPQGMYWAIVTLTTVGYGDIAPQTDLGRFIASIIMIMGYGIIAVPTGIVTAEIARSNEPDRAPGSSVPHVSTNACQTCGVSGHRYDAVFCRRCGAHL
ncbi:Cyclic nucleotide-gated potassium channel [Planctomycetes bacterium Pla163]|jgi:voltage-gated potassium channel|uniref:Cyclic nucleotide-gated potassium channel n=1 Tax=Rohdeia mirabilis TaxID=2528008 RepID=A0A518CVI0_9BACT|nr:Cyclic nucleotide-gated potassium channel [Planctomycetes bacterium Pla163]